MSTLRYEDYDEFWNAENPQAYKYLDKCREEVLDSLQIKVYDYQFLNRLKHSKIAAKLGMSEKKLKAIKRKIKRNLLNCLGRKKANLSE